MANQIVGTISIQNNGNAITAVTVDEQSFNDSFTIGLDGVVTATGVITESVTTYTVNATNNLGTTSQTFSLEVTEDISIYTNLTATASSSEITATFDVALTEETTIVYRAIPQSQVNDSGSMTELTTSITYPAGTTSQTNPINSADVGIGYSVAFYVSIDSATSGIGYINPVTSFMKES